MALNPLWAVESEPTPMGREDMASHFSVPGTGAPAVPEPGPGPGHPVVGSTNAFVWGLLPRLAPLQLCRETVGIAGPQACGLQGLGQATPPLRASVSLSVPAFPGWAHFHPTLWVSL